MLRNTQLVAIINLTPDSFSDGGAYPAPEHAVLAIKQAIDQGADVIDIGAESTRPGAKALTADEEWERLVPVLPEVTLLKKSGARFSLDTRHAKTAAKALAYGIDWINDVSGFASPLMRDAVRGSSCNLVVMHSLSVPADKQIVLPEGVDVAQVLIDFAKARFSELQAAGIASGRMIFDPGIGFGKTAAQSYEILHNIERLHVLGMPIFVGHSRKSFLGDAQDRDAKTLAISRQLFGKVDYVRVHDVAAHRALFDASYKVAHG